MALILRIEISYYRPVLMELNWNYLMQKSIPLWQSCMPQSLARWTITGVIFRFMKVSLCQSAVIMLLVNHQNQIAISRSLL